MEGKKGKTTDAINHGIRRVNYVHWYLIGGLLYLAGRQLSSASTYADDLIYLLPNLMRETCFLVKFV